MLCQREGLVKLGQVALDGAKVRANASKHKTMSYKRRWIKRTAGTAGTIAVMSFRRSWPLGRPVGVDKEAMAALEAEAQAAAEQAEAEGKDHPGVPDDKAQRNFTGPESRITPGSWWSGLPASL